MAKAIFASDIDKTLTDERHIIPDEVVNYLGELYKEGWEIVLLTGRTFSFAMMSLDKIDFPFYLAVQNGAEVLKMPEKKIVFQTFVSKEVAYKIDAICDDYSEDFLIYSGFEDGDFCYYRTSKFSPFFLDYIEKLKKLSASDWVKIKNLHEISKNSFPLIKCLGDFLSLQKIQAKISDIELLTSYLISDTVDSNLSILLVTHKDANKGIAFKKIVEKCGWNCPIIAAGDDNNDIPLLQVADIGIAMSSGSRDLQLHADIIANPSTELGIIPAIQEVKRRLNF
jgi:Cof subfamily protein (haloacid dehalogenase superfamily)